MTTQLLTWFPYPSSDVFRWLSGGAPIQLLTTESFYEDAHFGGWFDEKQVLVRIDGEPVRLCWSDIKEVGIATNDPHWMAR